MSQSPTSHEIRRCIDRLTQDDAETTVSVPLADLTVVLDFITAGSAFDLAEAGEPVFEAVAALSSAAQSQRDSPFAVTYHGSEKLLVTHDGDLIGGFSTDYHADGEGLLYRPDHEQPVAVIRGYTDTDSDE